MEILTLPLVNANVAKLFKRLLGVVHTAEAIAVAIVGDLMVVLHVVSSARSLGGQINCAYPDRDPRKFAVGKQEIFIRTVCSQATPVVVECHNLPLRLHRTGLRAGLVLIDVVAQLLEISQALHGSTDDLHGSRSQYCPCGQHCRMR